MKYIKEDGNLRPILGTQTFFWPLTPPTGFRLAHTAVEGRHTLCARGPYARGSAMRGGGGGRKGHEPHDTEVLPPPTPGDSCGNPNRDAPGRPLMRYKCHMHPSHVLVPHPPPIGGAGTHARTHTQHDTHGRSGTLFVSFACCLSLSLPPSPSHSWFLHHFPLLAASSSHATTSTRPLLSGWLILYRGVGVRAGRRGPPSPFQGAQPIPSHCTPDSKCKLQWHL